MPNSKTLHETLNEAVRETKDTQAAANDETKEGLSNIGNSDGSGETKAGETPEYASGIDISDIPENDRPHIRELLKKKAGLLENGYQKKFTEVAAFKKAQDELLAAGLTLPEAQKVLNDYLEQKRTPKQKSDITAKKEEEKRILDELLESVPYEERTNLERFRKIIHQETDVKALVDKIEKIEAMLGGIAHFTTESKKGKLESELSSLSEKYGKDIIEKYKETIISEGLKYDLPPRKILFYVVPEDELEQAIISKGKKPLTEEKKNAIISSGSGISGKETIDEKNVSMRDLLKNLSKK